MNLKSDLKQSRLKLLSIPLLIMGLYMAGYTLTKGPGEYRESRGEIARYSTVASDKIVQVIPCVQLMDSSYELPTRFFLQGHQTSTGFRKVEKRGDIIAAIRSEFPDIMLPVSEKIKTHLLLIRKLVQVNDPEIARTSGMWAYSDWHLLEIPAKDLNKDRPIILSAIEELGKPTPQQQELTEKLLVLYEKAFKEQEIRNNTPVRPWHYIPEWAR